MLSTKVKIKINKMGLSPLATNRTGTLDSQIAVISIKKIMP